MSAIGTERQLPWLVWLAVALLAAASSVVCATAAAAAVHTPGLRAFTRAAYGRQRLYDRPMADPQRRQRPYLYVRFWSKAGMPTASGACRSDEEFFYEAAGMSRAMGKETKSPFASNGNRVS